MKLTDIFRGIDEIGKEVRFYPKLNVITGSNNASLLLCYLIGWCGNQADKKEGWMCQSNSDISEQTGLTRKEQQSARKALKKLGVIEEQLRGIPRTTYYRLKIDTLNEIWNRYREDPDGYTIKRPDVKPDVKGGFRDELPDISNDIRSLQESSNQDVPKEQLDFSLTTINDIHSLQESSNQDGQNAQLYTVSSSVSSSVDSAVSPRTHDAPAPAHTRDIQKKPHPSSSQTSSSIAVDEKPPTHKLHHPDRNSTTLFDTEKTQTTKHTSQTHEDPIPSTPPSGAPPSSGSKSKSSKPAEPADPAVRRIIDSFHNIVVETYGFKPGLQAGRDGKAIKQMLPYADEEILTGYVVGFVSSGQWKAEHSPYIFEFVTGKRINAYQIRLSEQKGSVLAATDKIPCDEIVEHLNDRTGSTFKASDPSTVRVINDRWKEGYRLDDFLKVIDNMTAKWGRDAKMMEFLRPATLFGEKFGNYLGVKVTPVDLGILSRTGYESNLVIGNWMEKKRKELRAREGIETGDAQRADINPETSDDFRIDLSSECGNKPQSALFL
ncbi:MAG: conserved phage C-terminal domain-containing protein [Eubacteriales bacterium]|nr:conserved phage C-terminal domain-containing protein [Eubacteriales bacterium]